MSSILNIAVSGLNNAASRIANTASSIVNASSTKNISYSSGTDLASDLVSLSTEKTDYSANAVVIKAAEKIDKALIDIKV